MRRPLGDPEEVLTHNSPRQSVGFGFLDLGCLLTSGLPKVYQPPTESCVIDASLQVIQKKTCLLHAPIPLCDTTENLAGALVRNGRSHRTPPVKVLLGFVPKHTSFTLKLMCYCIMGYGIS